MTGSVIPAVISIHGPAPLTPSFSQSDIRSKIQTVSILQRKRSIRVLFFYSRIDQHSYDDHNKSNERLCPLSFEIVGRKR